MFRDSEIGTERRGIFQYTQVLHLIFRVAESQRRSGGAPNQGSLGFWLGKNATLTRGCWTSGLVNSHVPLKACPAQLPTPSY